MGCSCIFERLFQVIIHAFIKSLKMDTPSLKAFVSPRCNSRRQISELDLHPSQPTKSQSSKLLQLMDKSSLSHYIKELQSNIKQQCCRIQTKLGRVGLGSSSSKQNMNPHANTLYKSCQSLKKSQSRSAIEKATKSKNKSQKEDGSAEKPARKQKLVVSTEVEWVHNKKLEALMGQVQTTTNILAKTFEKEGTTPKPRTIKNLFQKKSEKEDRREERRYATKSSLPVVLSIRNFQIVRKLGKGRFGNVYLAQEKSSKFVVALKTISKKVIMESMMVAQLTQQIKIQTCLQHPNLLKMYGFFSDHENIYLVLQTAIGGNLFRQLRSQKRFPQRKCAIYLKQVLQAVAYLHRNGVIHRDIKPQNILLNNGVLKLSDFGWSVYSPQQPRQTFCGTLDYVPPEIVIGKTYDYRVDLWSMGVLCFEMATGKAPFENRGCQDQTYEKIVRTEFQYPEYLSTGIKDFIQKLLVKNPKKRMSLEDALGHHWLMENSKGGFSVSREVYNSYSLI